MDEALTLYPSSPDDNRAALSKATTHAYLQCAARRVARARSGLATWLYHWAAPDECLYDPATYGVPHCAELPFVFDQFECDDMPSAAEASLAARTGSLWAALARDGAPEASWPAAFDADGRSYELRLAANATTGDVELDRDADFCDFWDRDSPYGGGSPRGVSFKSS